MNGCDDSRLLDGSLQAGDGGEVRGHGVGGALGHEDALDRLGDQDGGQRGDEGALAHLERL